MVLIFIILWLCYHLFSFIFTSSEAGNFALRSFEGLSPMARRFVKSDKALATLVLGNNKANILVGQLLGQMVGNVLPSTFQGLPWAVFMLFTTVVICEYITKAVGEARPELVLNFCAPILLISGWGMTPLVCGLTYLKKYLPKPQKNEDEEELVEAAMQLDTTPVSEMMLKAPPAIDLAPDQDAAMDLAQDWSKFWDRVGGEGENPRLFSGVMSDVAVRVLKKEGSLVIIDDRGKVVGLLDHQQVVDVLFDHH